MHMALPLIRDRWRADMSEGEARALLEDCMRVLWYRDTKALNKVRGRAAAACLRVRVSVRVWGGWVAG
jgi:20S proteasome subunit beta 7